MRDNNHILRKVNLIRKIVESDIKDSADPRSCKVLERTDLHPEKVERHRRRNVLEAGGGHRK